jgi:hypothetical protein
VRARIAVVVFMLMGLGSLARAQEPVPSPDPPRAVLADPHTGLGLLFGFGMQNVRGNGFGNRIKPGASVELGLAYRVHSQVALETGFVRGTGTPKGGDEPANFYYALNLDARWFPLGAARFEPSLVAGYGYWTIASYEVAPAQILSLRGFSPKVGVSARWYYSRRGFAQAEVRYLYTRFTEYYTAEEGEYRSLPHQLHGDAFLAMGQVGVQF